MADDSIARPRSYFKWARDADLDHKVQAASAKKHNWWTFAALTYASVGVIYGDIGTSPLYTYASIFATRIPTKDDVLGATSLIFWSITLMVLVKYAFIVLLANDNGEGGTFALYSLLCRVCNIPTGSGAPLPSDQTLSRYSVNQNEEGDEGAARPRFPYGNSGTRLRRFLEKSHIGQVFLLVLVLFLTSLVVADGILTPAISVLSAVSGLKVATPLDTSATVGITCAILVVLFAIQPFGTARIGVMFSPTVVLWLLSNVAIAAYNINRYEGISILRALSPSYAVQYFQRDFYGAWIDLGGVFLSITGCEALFADLGHFSVAAIRVSFSCICYPCIVFTYLGQASWLMYHLDQVSTTFYSSIPDPVFWPMLVLATAAAIVASQALITGAFSIVRQSVALGCFPRVKIAHTSSSVEGQVYIPSVNWGLLVLTIAVVAGFQDGTKIGNAYGIAINLVMAGTTLLMGLTMMAVWDISLLATIPVVVLFLSAECLFLSANLTKFHHGGWFSIVIGAVVAYASWVWYWGSRQKTQALHSDFKQLSHLITLKRDSPAPHDRSPRLVRTSTMSPVTRISGIALVYSESVFTVPKTFVQMLQNWGVHDKVVFVTVRQVALPHVDPEECLLLMPLEIPGFYRCVARYGYMDPVHQDIQFVEQLWGRIEQLASPIADRAVNPTKAVSTESLPKASAPESGPSHDEIAVPAESAPMLSLATGQLPETPAGGDSSEVPPVPVGDATSQNNEASASLSAASVPSQTAVVNVISSSLLAAGPIVYVLSRPIFRAKQTHNYPQNVLHQILVASYSFIWTHTTRTWEQWKVPGNSLFEIGTVCSL